MRYLKTIVLTMALSVLTAFAMAQAQDSIAKKLVLDEFDIAPQFPGGISAWQRFLSNNLDIRGLAAAVDSTQYVEYGLRQRALLEFTVCEDGRVCDVIILNKSKISPEFANEALRVMSKSPKWQPGTKEGRAVNTKFSQSIIVVLQD